MSQVFRRLFAREAPSALSELIGQRCRVIFDLPYNQWPFEGTPAWLYVIAVDGPMIKLSMGEEGIQSKWVSQACILSIQE